ncbi:MAG: transporter substrate-binding domain-containing protein, partial [Oceanospirillales bacterium]|nr:transporter substrate-binding domain-containing protein [Oceanospirillales bacterium]
LCQALERTCDIKAVAWTDLLDELQAGKLDMVVASMAKTREREAQVDFTDYYYQSHSIFAGRPEVTDTTPTALMGKPLATARATIQADFLNKHYTRSRVILTDNMPQALQMLLEGKVDFVLSDTTNLLDFLERPQAMAAGMDFVGDPVKSPELQSKAHIAVKKGDQVLREEINRALEQLRLNGTYDQINRKYFPFSIY